MDVDTARLSSKSKDQVVSALVGEDGGEGAEMYGTETEERGKWVLSL